MIPGHKATIRRLGRSSPTRPGPFETKCECGFRKVAQGHAVVARMLALHHKEIRASIKKEEEKEEEKAEFQEV